MAVSKCKAVGDEKAWVSMETAKEISGQVEIAINIRPPTNAQYEEASTGVADSKDL